MQVEEERQVDGEVDVVGIYGFWDNGGVALSRLTQHSNDGTALSLAKPSHATENWPDADWPQAIMDPVPDSVEFSLEELTVRHLAPPEVPGGRSGSGVSGCGCGMGARATAHQTAPARPRAKICPTSYKRP